MAPRDEIGEDEEEARGKYEEYVEEGREGFVGEVGKWCEEGDDGVVAAGEVFHDVLEVAHVTEEVFGQFSGWFDGSCGCQWWTVKRI